MRPIDYLLIACIVLIFGAILFFVVRSRKKGKKCIGCPNGTVCSKEPCAGGCAGCSGHGNCKNHHETTS